MKDQASKLREWVGHQNLCKHGRADSEGSKCLQCAHDDKLKVKDDKIKSLENKIKALEDDLDVANYCD